MREKLLSLLLSLMLLLPGFSLGEAETYTVEYDDFILTVSDRDLLQTGEETGSSSLFQLFPDYDEHAGSHPNFSASWSPGVMDNLTDEQVYDFCNGFMQSGVQSLLDQNIAVSNIQMLLGERNDDTGAISILFSIDADVAALGLDMTVTVYMGCLFVPLGEKGNYSFTLGCSSVEEAEELFAYLDKNLIFKD